MMNSVPQGRLRSLADAYRRLAGPRPASTLSLDPPIPVYPADVIRALRAYQGGGLTLPALVDWVNTMWFSDAYTYAEGCDDSIASVMDRLEELDEPGQALAQGDIEAMVEALEANREWSPMPKM